jgi:NAD(P)-dependent dehydrogenase (short-subunit alcohol dehydrogenase family)/tetratricopeptide (TPR) repeat protein
LLLLAACSREPDKGRIAVLPFENLTGDSQYDWLAAAGPAILASEINALRAGTPGDAYLVNAGRLVHGYYTRSAAGLKLELAVESVGRHKLGEPKSYNGAVLSTASAAAKDLDPSARAFSSNKEDAVEAWGRRDFEKATSLDADFGAAWLAWIEERIQHNDREQAIKIADQALARAALRSDLDRSRIELLSANLRNDSAARLAALRKLAQQMDDSATLLALAEAEVNARQFDAAIASFNKFLSANPDNANALLSLGYAQAYAGQLDAAKQTFERYGRLPGQQLNSLDSLGEAFFMNGKFAEAEKYFSQAFQSNPRFLNGADLIKAAYAHWLSGDAAGADAMAAKAFQDPWRQAAWLYSTGRRDQAIAKLQQVPDKRVADRQLAIWNAPLPSDLETLKKQYEQTAPSTDGQVRIFYAAALLKAGHAEEATDATVAASGRAARRSSGRVARFPNVSRNPQMKTLIVTGASRGIGAAIARMARDYRVIVNYSRDRGAAENLAAEIGGIAIQADVSKEAEVLQMFDRAGFVDALVNNAGITGGFAKVEDFDAARVDEMLRVNVLGTMLCSREAVRRMKTGGAIVNISSLAARTGGVGEWVHYAASKGAVDTFTIGLAREVAAQGIRVNAVAPGLIETGIHAANGKPDRLAKLAPGIPMQRPGTAEEVAEAVLWLLSPAASYVTGSILEVGGGR